MNKYEISKKIEAFAPLSTQEEWDCSGWGVDVQGYDEIKKIMLCLTVTDNIIKQAKENHCDMIVSHHPLFYAKLNWGDINIYCAHTNLDKAHGGTTDTLIKNLLLNGLDKYCQNPPQITFTPDEFLRILDLKKEILISDFSKNIKTISPNARFVNNQNVKSLKKIAFCAGSGSEFINVAKNLGADCLVTGDLKFHTALESPIVLYDAGHFESEVLVLPVFKRLIGSGVEIVKADEHSPFFPISF